MQTAKVQVRLYIRAVSPEPMLYAKGQGEIQAKELNMWPCYGARHVHWKTDSKENRRKEHFSQNEFIWVGFYGIIYSTNSLQQPLLGTKSGFYREAVIVERLSNQKIRSNHPNLPPGEEKEQFCFPLPNRSIKIGPAQNIFVTISES